eukprot:1158665-Pyramimonas_sp.AAC.2
MWYLVYLFILLIFHARCPPIVPQHATSKGLAAGTPSTNGFYGVILALARCQRVTLYGFARKWTPRIQLHADDGPLLRYHYFDTEEPVQAQHDRDDAEFLALLHLTRKHPNRLRFGEPCISGCQTDTYPRSPPGSLCSCGLWHPVPKRGFCYRRHSQESVGCFHKCNDEAACIGGQASECPPDGSLYEAVCTHPNT